MPRYTFTCGRCGTQVGINRLVTLRKRYCPNCGQEIRADLARRSRQVDYGPLTYSLECGV